MPPFKRSARKTHVVKKTLADGTVKTYRYERSKTKAIQEPSTVGALTVAYRNSVEWRALSPKTQQTRESYLRKIELLKSMPVASVTRRMLLTMRDEIASGGKNGAANGFIKTASVLFGWAVERDWLASTPVYKIEPLPGGHLPAWSMAQAEAALATMPEPLRRVVVLGLYTGQRRGDLIALPWSAYDGASIRLTQQKTGTALVLPVHPTLKAELDAWRREAVSTIILTTKRGIPWSGHHVSESMRLWMTKAAMPGLNVHGLRKLMAARLANAGASTHEIASMTGHKTLALVQLYTASADQERLAGAAIHRLSVNRGKPAKRDGK